MYMYTSIYIYVCVYMYVNVHVHAYADVYVHAYLFTYIIDVCLDRLGYNAALPRMSPSAAEVAIRPPAAVRSAGRRAARGLKRAFRCTHLTYGPNKFQVRLDEAALGPYFGVGDVWMGVGLGRKAYPLRVISKACRMNRFRDTKASHFVRTC